MIKDKVEKALNKQLNEELHSSYVYLAMCAYFQEQNLTGFAHWFKLQSQEEYGHAMKIFNYLHQANGKVAFAKIETPKTTWKTPLEIFQDTYKQEQDVTKSIYNIVDIAIAEKDHAAFNFLQWFVSEQVEEESTALNLVDRMKLVGDNKNGLYLFDRELAQRAAQG